jgi:hypothetical protein
MLDQLVIGDRGSLDEFGASIAERSIGQPKKKEIKETIPFSNVTYDFSAINGELYWEERELEYIFEITANTPQELEASKTTFAAWVMNVVEEEIHDPFIADFHFVGTYSDMTFDDEESIEKTTATVKFKAYPYKVANNESIYRQTVPVGGSANIEVVNNSSHRLSPVITVDTACSITINNIVYTLPAGTYTGDSLWLEVGETVFEVSNPSTTDACVVTISFCEEVF